MTNEDKPNPNSGAQDPNKNSAQNEQALQNAIHAALRVHIPKAVESAAKPLIDELAALKAQLETALRGKSGEGQAGQENVAKANGKTEQELRLEALHREIESLKANNQRAELEAKEQRIKTALIEAAAGKVRPGMAGNFVHLAHSKVKTAQDGTLSIELDGQSFDLKSGIAAMLKDDSYAGFNQPVQTPARPVKAPMDLGMFSNGQTPNIAKMQPEEFGAAFFKTQG